MKKKIAWSQSILPFLTFACCADLTATKLIPEQQITNQPYGHVLTNSGVWSPDSRWIVYDVRSDDDGSMFDGSRIERVNIETRQIEILYESKNGANCGVATCSSTDSRIAFIHGPEHPTDAWQYSAYHRRGVLVDVNQLGVISNLDARNIMMPFTAGALRGGTHVHTFSGDGKWVAFTYEDHVLASADAIASESPRRLRDINQHDINQRNVGVSVPVRPVDVPATSDRNHSGSHFSVLVTQTVSNPKGGSDEISKAFSDAWVGTNGYLRRDGTRQRRAIAFQGHVATNENETIAEVFIVDIPDDVTQPSDLGPLQGTERLLPKPPRGTKQRRLTFSSERKYPGIEGPRHWLRSSPDGSQIAFLMKDDAGIAQIWTISPTGGEPQQVTDNEFEIGSAFSWSPDGKFMAHVMNDSVCITLVDTRKTVRLTTPSSMLRPEACVVSPDGKKIAYAKTVESTSGRWNQIFVVSVRFD